MNDQASTLREIVSEAQSNQAKDVFSDSIHQSISPEKQRTRTIAVTSGKGGVGKTNFSVNLATALAALHRRVTLLDADMGLANADLIFGVNPTLHLGHFFENKCRLEEVVMQLRNGVRLIPGGSGIEELANLPVARNTLLMAQLQVLEASSDFMIIDCAAGIGENVTGILMAASQVVIVAMPEPPSIVDAYATMKVISRHASDKRISLVVNNVSGISEAGQIYKQLNTASERFLKQKLEFLGAIPQDPQLVEAVCQQVPVIEYAPDAASSRAIKIIARELNEEFLQPSANKNTKSFWNSLISQSLT